MFRVAQPILFSLLFVIITRENHKLAIKREALRIINASPDDTDIEEILYRLYIVGKICKSQQAIERNQVLSSDELKQEIETW